MTVNGFVFVRDVQWILCNRLDEISYPPECSGGSLRVANPAALAALKLTEGIGQAHGLRWTETPVSLLGSVEGDAFRVTEIVKG